MTNLLITGGAGFIGAHFTRYWRQGHAGDALVVLDALTYAGDVTNLDGVSDLTFVKGDIRDQGLVEKLLADHDIDSIVHFAAETHVDRSIHSPDLFIDTNVNGTHSLLKAAKAVWLDKGSGRPHRFHHVSTDEVYGSLGPDDPPSAEGSAYAPNSPYSASKAAADHLVRAYARTYGLHVTTSLGSNTYGPRQFPEKLIPLCLRNALHGRPLPIYGDGLHVRDWLYVDDHCRGIQLVLEAGRVGEAYNICSGAELTNLAVIDKLCATVDAAFQADAALARRFPDAPAARGQQTASLKAFVEDRPGHDRRYAMDLSKAQRETSFTARTTFALGLALTTNGLIARSGNRVV